MNCEISVVLCVYHLLLSILISVSCPQSVSGWVWNRSVSHPCVVSVLLQCFLSSFYLCVWNRYVSHPRVLCLFLFSTSGTQSVFVCNGCVSSVCYISFILPSLCVCLEWICFIHVLYLFCTAVIVCCVCFYSVLLALSLCMFGMDMFHPCVISVLYSRHCVSVCV